MKQFRKTIKLFLALIAITLITISCSNNEDLFIPNSSSNTNAVVTDNNNPANNNSSNNSTTNYTVFKEALKITNLNGFLTSREAYTLFAPNDNAFKTFLIKNNYDSLEDIPVDALRKIILNHIISGKKISDDLDSPSKYIKTLSKESPSESYLSMYINNERGIKINGYSSVIKADLFFSNSVIHIVDVVIEIPTINTFITADTNFEVLEDALTKSDYNFIDIFLASNNTYTVFAPVDKAFEIYLEESNLNDIDEIDTQRLDAILKIHTVSDINILASEINDNVTISTLGGNITASIANNKINLIDPNNRSSNILTKDIQATNGVIHMVDKVILP